jgi:hypothetical protein
VSSYDPNLPEESAILLASCLLILQLNFILCSLTRLFSKPFHRLSVPTATDYIKSFLFQVHFSQKPLANTSRPQAPIDPSHTTTPIFLKCMIFIVPFLCLFFFFWTGSYLAQVGLKLTICLPQSLQC